MTYHFLRHYNRANCCFLPPPPFPPLTRSPFPEGEGFRGECRSAIDDTFSKVEAFDSKISTFRSLPQLFLFNKQDFFRLPRI